MLITRQWSELSMIWYWTHTIVKNKPLLYNDILSDFVGVQLFSKWVPHEISRSAVSLAHFLPNGLFESFRVWDLDNGCSSMNDMIAIGRLGKIISLGILRRVCANDLRTIPRREHKHRWTARRFFWLRFMIRPRNRNYCFKGGTYAVDQ